LEGILENFEKSRLETAFKTKVLIFSLILFPKVLVIQLDNEKESIKRFGGIKKPFSSGC